MCLTPQAQPWTAVEVDITSSRAGSLQQFAVFPLLWATNPSIKPVDRFKSVQVVDRPRNSCPLLRSTGYGTGSKWQTATSTTNIRS